VGGRSHFAEACACTPGEACSGEGQAGGCVTTHAGAGQMEEAVGAGSAGQENVRLLLENERLRMQVRILNERLRLDNERLRRLWLDNDRLRASAASAGADPGQAVDDEVMVIEDEEAEIAEP
jgi:hypothetical protein